MSRASELVYGAAKLFTRDRSGRDEKLNRELILGNKLIRRTCRSGHGIDHHGRKWRPPTKEGETIEFLKRSVEKFYLVAVGANVYF